jgi:hypothetical protein
MNPSKLIAIALIAGGLIGLTVGSFSFTKETHQGNIGPLEFSVDEKQTVNIPLWASIISIAAGTGLLLVGFKRT